LGFDGQLTELILFKMITDVLSSMGASIPISTRRKLFVTSQVNEAEKEVPSSVKTNLHSIVDCRTIPFIRSVVEKIVAAW
jgi:hypothetical protein